MKNHIFKGGVIAMTIALSLVARAERGGNGMGVICLPNKPCITLAEAGLTEKATPEGFYRIDPKVIDALQDILRRSGLSARQQKILLDRSLGSTETFVPVETIDPQKFRELKVAYFKAIGEIDPSFDLNNLSIAAWSAADKNKTYLIMQDFEKLTDERKALTLIHEGNVRGLGQDALVPAIRFDILLRKLLDHPGLVNQPGFDNVMAYKILKEISLAEGTEFGALLNFLKKKGVDALPVSEVCEQGAYLNSDDSRACETDYVKLLKLADIDPRITIYLEQSKLAPSEIVNSFSRPHFVDQKKWDADVRNVCLEHEPPAASIDSKGASVDLLVGGHATFMAEPWDAFNLSCSFTRVNGFTELTSANTSALFVEKQRPQP